jgi:hypothetical protein
MADVTVVATVTPDSSSSTGFNWSYTVAGTGFTITADGALQIPSDSSPEIMMNVVPGGQPTDTCVFQNPLQDPQQNPPLTFTDWQKKPVDPPQWFQGLEFLDPSTILFTDDNTNIHTRNYYVFANVVYNDTLTTCPDPTIINVGTDGGDVVIDPRRPVLSQARPQPAAEA